MVVIKLGEHLDKVPFGVALLRRLPFFFVEFPAGRELLLELGAQREGQVRVELLNRELAVPILINLLEGEFVEVRLVARALLEADRADRALEPVTARRDARARRA